MRVTGRTVRAWSGDWVDTRYQLRFTLLMVLVGVGLMAGLGWIVASKARAATAVSVHAVEAHPEYFKDPDAAMRRLLERERTLDRLLLDFGIALTIGLFFYGLRMTHRIVDPLERIGRHLDGFRHGRFTTVEPLPAGDQLAEFYDRFKTAHASLRRTEAEDALRMKTAAEAIEAAGLAGRSLELRACTERMRARAQEKEAGLG